jgi:hypothetical protein
MTTIDQTFVTGRRVRTGTLGAQGRLALALTLSCTMAAGGIAYADTGSSGSDAPALPSIPAPSADSTVPVAVAVHEQPEPAPSEAPPGPSSHHFQWAAQDDHRPEGAINFGLLQLALGGFNLAGEIRYRRWWFEYSHGMELTLNNASSLTMTSTERQQGLHIYLPYTTGFGVGVTLLDELWLGVEFKDHKYEVNAPGGPVVSYNTYSIGPVLGYKLFIARGLFLNAYVRYWPTVASTLDGGKVTLQGTNGPVVHDAHDWGFFANLAVGYAFDL